MQPHLLTLFSSVTRLLPSQPTSPITNWIVAHFYLANFHSILFPITYLTQSHPFQSFKIQQSTEFTFSLSSYSTLTPTPRNFVETSATSDTSTTYPPPFEQYD
ncbi:hypothetical protein O5D80_002760 [Batrachochytrium dendrobatidis]|nr:hypothetical protein O5D80_006364 [Batrachochytrium dendrobatidis]KAJ8328777.1 hypothetical protein O5D80_002760 [Batrachochytrium dendrobatidis]